MGSMMSSSLSPPPPLDERGQQARDLYLTERHVPDEQQTEIIEKLTFVGQRLDQIIETKNKTVKENTQLKIDLDELIEQNQELKSQILKMRLELNKQ